MILRDKQTKNINFVFFFVSKNHEYIIKKLYLKIIFKNTKKKKIKKSKKKKKNKK